MIDHFAVSNFKCLLDVKVDLGPFNIFIGPNDCGKSSLLDAIRLLGKTAAMPWSEVFPGTLPLEDYVWRKDATRVIRWRIQGSVDGKHYGYGLGLAPFKSIPVEEEFSGDAFQLNQKPGPPGIMTYEYHAFGQLQKVQGPTGDYVTVFKAITDIYRHFGRLSSKVEPGHVSHQLGSIVKYQLDPEVLRQAGRINTAPILSSTGDNLVSVLHGILTSPDAEERKNLESELHAAIRWLRGITVQPHNGSQEQLQLDYVLEGKKPYVTIPASLASDGAILFTAFLAMAYGNTPDIVMIEEPENGLHPSRMQMVVEILRKISTGEIGNRPRQVIVTTHSPLLLNYARPEEVKVFQRSEEKGVTVTPMAEAPNIENLLKEFGTGELWYLLGEEGLLKEQPA